MLHRPRQDRHVRDEGQQHRHEDPVPDRLAGDQGECHGQGDEQNRRPQQDPPDPRVGPARDRVGVLDVLDGAQDALAETAIENESTNSGTVYGDAKVTKEFFGGVNVKQERDTYINTKITAFFS